MGKGKTRKIRKDIEHRFRKKERFWTTLPKTKPVMTEFLKYGKNGGEDYSPLSAYMYERILDNFFSIVRKEYDDVTAQDIQKYFDELKMQIDKITIKNRLGIIQRFYTWLIKKKGFAKTNPVVESEIKISNKVESDIRNKKLREIPSDKEVNRMLDTTQHPRDHLILSLLANTGMRVSELCSLRLDDVEKGVLIIDGKGDYTRPFPILPQFMTTLENWLRYRKVTNPKSEYLIVSKQGNKLVSDYVRKIIRDACKRAGVDKPLTPHSFRRKWATRNRELGIPIAKTMYFGGWSSEIMVNHYTQFGDMRKSIITRWKSFSETAEEEVGVEG